VIREHLRQICVFHFLMGFQDLCVKNVFRENIGEEMERYWPPTNSFLLLGVCASVSNLVKIDEEMRPWLSTDGQTHTRSDAKRFYYLSNAICYSYGADNNQFCIGLCVIMWTFNINQSWNSIIFRYKKVNRLRPMSHLHFFARFCHATLSRDKIASVTWRVAQLLNSRANPFPIKAVLYSVQLYRENAVNADWSILVYHVTKLQCATRHVTLRFFRAIKLRDKIAR